jgi:formamidopyrimidine-DNA glycosylase
MPELPEVETARRIIEQRLVGALLAAIELRLPKLLRYSDASDLSLLIGQALLAARRRAKVLVLDWSGDWSTVMHLKLSGQISVHVGEDSWHAGHPHPDPAGEYPHKSTHLSLRFDGDRLLHFSDIRQFGWMRLMPTGDVDDFLDRQRFGPEAVGPDAITAAQLIERLAKRHIPVKLALLDQSIVAGIGNIYVDEALHRARIHPMRPANSIQEAEGSRLVEAIRWAIETGIAQGGAKIINNKAHPIDGFPEVHARKGEPCPVCGGTVVKTRVGQRGTYLCPTCQPEPTV